MLTYFIVLGVLIAFLAVFGRILPSILEFIAFLFVVPLYMLAGVMRVIDFIRGKT